MESSQSSFKLTIVRHGQTTGNIECLLHGFTDSCLTDLGHKQSSAAGLALKDSSNWTHVFTSDLKRTQETVEGILKHAPPNKDHERKADPRIRERCYGDMEGAHLNVLVKAQKEAGDSDTIFIPKNGETFEELALRFHSFMEVQCLKKKIGRLVVKNKINCYF